LTELILDIFDVKDLIHALTYSHCVFVSQAFIKGGSKMAEKGYCVKCKSKKEMKDEQKVTMKNGRNAMKGKCTTCGTGMYKILGMK